MCIESEHITGLSPARQNGKRQEGAVEDEIIALRHNIQRSSNDCTIPYDNREYRARSGFTRPLQSHYGGSQYHSLDDA